MSNLSHRTWLAIFIIISFFGLEMGLPSKCKAQWHRSDEIEESTISTETLILVGLATVGGILLISHLTKDKKEGNEKEDIKKEASDSTKTSMHLIQQERHSQCNLKSQKDVESPLSFYLNTSRYGIKGIDSKEKYLKFTNNTFTVGMNLRL